MAKSRREDSIEERHGAGRASGRGVLHGWVPRKPQPLELVPPLRDTTLLGPRCSCFDCPRLQLLSTDTGRGTTGPHGDEEGREARLGTGRVIPSMATDESCGRHVHDR
jgi:hypothetical protein